MDQFREGLDYPEYIHILLNHLPVTGLFVALVFLIVSLIFRNRGAVLISMGMIAVLALSAWPVAHFGHQGYDRVLSMTYEEGGQWLDHHKAMADRWIYLFYATAALAALGVIFGLLWSGSLKWFVPIVLLAALASVGVGAYLADVGGKVRHSEFRWGDPPVQEEGE